MPLASSSRLSPHFTAFELGADRPEANDLIVTNLTRTADYLEVIRAELGVPLIVNTQAHRNRGFRPPAANEMVGGSATSDHPNGKAADFTPVGMSLRTAYDKLTAARAAGRLPAYDQLIYYPASNYIHLGLGDRMRGENRIYLAEVASGTHYPFLTSDLVQRLGGAVAAVVATVVTALPNAPSLGVVLIVAVVAVYILNQ